MRSDPYAGARDGRRLLIVLLFLLALGVAVAATGPTSVRAEGGGALVAEPVLAATAAGVRELFGASPAEDPGEVWGVGTKVGEAQDLVRYTDAGGWESVPEPLETEGGAVGGIEVPEAATAGRTTAAGGVVAVAKLGSEGPGTPERARGLLVRDPGGEFRATVPPEGLLEASERLFEYMGPTSQALWIQLTAVDEPTGKTGAFVVPSSQKVNTKVLHYDGSSWSSEPICVGTSTECGMTTLPAKAKPGTGFKVVAIDASGPGNAWLLAKQEKTAFVSGKGVIRVGEGIMLFRREAGVWRKQKLGGARGELLASQEKQESVEGVKVFVKSREVGQPLTVTAKGIWIDATMAVGSEAQPSDATIYYDVGEGDPGAGQVTGAWCSLPSTTPQSVSAALCSAELPFDLPDGQSRSFAWPGSGTAGDFGARAITGVGKGAMLLFENGGFSRIPLAGNGGSNAGAAIAYPEKEGRGAGLGIEGWLGPSYHLTREPVPSGLVSWSVPFRRPLMAVAPQPGAPVGELSSEALAVGEAGQVARYTPGIGWQPESLLTGSGARATPNLRAVAWPVPGLAFAVGDEGAMWIWRSGTDLWEPDPGSPPNLIRGNFTGIAFDPNEPERGYAIGQQGLLLGYGRRWTQEALPPELGPEPNITSIAFAGNEAIATWSLASPKTAESGSTIKAEFTGGIIVNDGSGWRVEPQATEALKAAEDAGGNQFSPRIVAGLTDGGAAVAGGTGAIIERETAGAPWHAVPGPPLGVPVALQAVREGGQLRVIVSVEANAINAVEAAPKKVEEPQGSLIPPEGQAPLLIEPYALPASGYIVRQTATGWRDEERQSYPIPPKPTDQEIELKLDIPKIPDPVLAFLVSANGSHGWAVGGQTGLMASGPFEREGLQTAAVMRLGENAAPPQNTSTVPVPVSSAEATFAIGGNAQCADLCADLTGTGIGPDVWLRAAVGKAAATPGVRAFLYTGTSVASGLVESKISRDEFREEEMAYMRRLGSAAGPLPVFTAPAESDRYEKTLGIFGQSFAGFEQPLGLGSPALGIRPRSEVNPTTGQFFYSFDSEGAAGGPVRVAVLDYSTASLSAEQQCWLAGELSEAAHPPTPEAPRPVIVLGNREVGANVGLRQLLVTGANETTDLACKQAEPAAASAYFFDSPEANKVQQLGWGGTTIPAYGSGSLGYLRVPDLKLNEYGAASGFLLASVDTTLRSAVTNIAPVTARLIPSIGSLAIDALDGTFLRRSQVALFEGLARRPSAGIYCAGNDAPLICDAVKPNPYVQIPARCVNQASCLTEKLPEYRFASSRPDIANFVKVDPASSNPRAVFLNKENKPVADPSSGLLCAFNSGTTTVSVEAGGLAYSVQVTVQKGSVARPCGTVPRTDLAGVEKPIESPPPPLEQEPGFKPGPESITPPPGPVITHQPGVTQPTSIPKPHHVPAKPPLPLNPPYFFHNAIIAPVPVIVPGTPPATAEPAPPTGTSPVTQPAVSPEPEEEEEAAFDLVHHAVAVGHRPRAAAAIAAYRFQSGPSHMPWLIYALPSLVIIAALSSSGIAGRRRRREPEPAFLKHRR